MKLEIEFINGKHHIFDEDDIFFLTSNRTFTEYLQEFPDKIFINKEHITLMRYIDLTNPQISDIIKVES